MNIVVVGVRGDGRQSHDPGGEQHQREEATQKAAGDDITGTRAPPHREKRNANTTSAVPISQDNHGT